MFPFRGDLDGLEVHRIVDDDPQKTHVDGGLLAEGIEALKEVAASLDSVVGQLIGGIQSGMGYLGASHLANLRQRARYIRVSPAGQKEASPHDVIEVKTSSGSGDKA
jgi:IMP dehydrogenase